MKRILLSLVLLLTFITSDQAFARYLSYNIGSNAQAKGPTRADACEAAIENAENHEPMLGVINQGQELHKNCLSCFQRWNVAKRLFSEVGSNGDTILTELINKGILKNVSSTEVSFNDHYDNHIDTIKEIAGSDSDKILNLFQQAQQVPPGPEAWICKAHVTWRYTYRYDWQDGRAVQVDP